MVQDSDAQSANSDGNLCQRNMGFFLSRKHIRLTHMVEMDKDCGMTGQKDHGKVQLNSAVPDQTERAIRQ